MLEMESATLPVGNASFVPEVGTPNVLWSKRLERLCQNLQEG
jgi:hypothetical protein